MKCFDIVAPPPSSSSGSYNEYYTNDIGYSDKNIYNSGGYSDNTIYNSGGYSDNTIYNTGGYSDNNLYNSGGYLDNNIYNNFATAVEGGGGPLLDQQQILLSQPGRFNKMIYKRKDQIKSCFLNYITFFSEVLPKLSKLNFKIYQYKCKM